MKTDYQLAAGTRPPAFNYDTDIIILALNRFSETVEAVHSALAQSHVSFHVSILDQGSEPGIRSAFMSAFASLPHLGFFTVDANLGVAGGRNLLSGIGHGSIIIGLDNDAVFESDLVAAKALRHFAGTPELGALGFRILAQDGRALDETSWGYPQRLKSRRAGRFDTTTFVGAGHAIRRQSWVDAGGYDASLFFTWEEYDFCLAAIARNWLIRYDGALGVIHKVSPEARVAWNTSRTRYYVRNRLIIGRKWGASWFSLLPRMIGYVIKAIPNRCFRQTAAGIIAAIRLDVSLEKKSMSRAMRDYIERNETRHRGSLFERFRVEVLNCGKQVTAAHRNQKFFGYFFSKK